MTEARQAGAGARAASLAFVLAAAALGAWFIYGHAPLPTGAGAEDGAAAQAPAPPPEPAVVDGAECCGRGEPPPPPPAAQELMGGLFPVAASGRARAGRAEFLDGVEKVYRLRGYKSLGESLRASVRAGRRNPKPERFYWRYEPAAPAPAFIGATGPDADPHSEAASEQPASFNTLVTDDGEGGVQWMTFRQDSAAAAGAADFDSEAPGLDPPGVPRPPGLARRFGVGGKGDGSLIAFYTSRRPAVELVRWYAANMPPNWQYVPEASAQARAVSEGAMCFTRGRQFCLVWVAGGEGGEPTTVIVSFRG